MEQSAKLYKDAEIYRKSICMWQKQEIGLDVLILKNFWQVLEVDVTNNKKHYPDYHTKSLAAGILYPDTKTLMCPTACPPGGTMIGCIKNPLPFVSLSVGLQAGGE